MPELPEVETVVRELKPELSGKILTGIDVLWPKTFRAKSQTPLKGRCIKTVARKGKYIVFQLDRGALVVHLRMTGQLLFTINKKQSAHVRAVFKLNNGLRLYFRDVRKFGRIDYVDNAQDILAAVGIDALNPDLDERNFFKILQKSRMNLKAFLLSQKFISGLGNIYVDESLFRAGLHPASIAEKIPLPEALRLFKEIRFVLNFAVEHMGSTISDYRDAFGNSGGAQKFFRVYQRNGQPCLVCGGEIKKIKFAGRGTHFCPNCQKKYV